LEHELAITDVIGVRPEVAQKHGPPAHFAGGVLVSWRLDSHLDVEEFCTVIRPDGTEVQGQMVTVTIRTRD
jgi:hypothetical protein